MMIRLRQYAGLRSYAPLGVYALLALLVLWPLLARGFVFATDMVFVPHPPMPAQLTPAYPYEALLHWVSLWVPADIVQKGILAAIIAMSGLGMHRLMQQWESAAKNHAVYFFAGLLYAVNPFVYSRFMIGQYLILAGYALLPFCLRAVDVLCTKPGYKAAARLAIWLALVGVLSIHMFGIALVATVVFVAFKLTHRGFLRSAWRYLAASAGLLLVLTAYWWLPVVFGGSAIQSTTDGFTISDAAAFATPGSWWAILGHIMALQGFWADYQNLYQIPQYVFGWWWLPIVVLWALVAGGVYTVKRRKGRLFWPLLVVGGIALFLSIGVSGTSVAGINGWLVQHVPFFAGYREPQKFVALLCVVYAYFGAVSVGAILERIKQQRDVAAGLLLVVPFGLAPLMMWGFAGQMHTAQYPKGWYEARSYLQEQCTGQCQTIFVPWHLYLHYDFAGRIIANPAPKFFGGNSIASTNPEIKGASAYSWTDTQGAVSQVLVQGEQGGSQVAASLHKARVTFVVLIKGYDSGTYSFLDHQKDITLVKENQSLRIYKVGD